MIELNLKKLLNIENKDQTLDIDIKIKTREFITLFGKSGAGKTTILKMIAGLVQPDEGFIKVNGQLWFDKEKNINLPPQKRKVGFVFQDYALFPNMTVEQNIKFGMEKEDKNFLKELLEITELYDIKDRKPVTLSGGQRQRVALARAVARKPDILLLDEPLSALDFEIRQKLQEKLKEIHNRFDLTTVLVSHDFSEIFKLSNRVFVLENGKITRSGKPEDVFVQERLSGKVKFSGEILGIKKDDVVCIVSVLIGGNIIKVIATQEEAKSLSVGDKVVIASKAFNPFILKID